LPSDYLARELSQSPRKIWEWMFLVSQWFP
jgi:hypothetical protein